ATGDGVLGEEGRCQPLIDRLLIELDGTPNKSNLGANAILGVSLACASASAHALELPLFRYLGGTNARVLPVPLMNVLNGGAHADNNVDLQEFMIVPQRFEPLSGGLLAGGVAFHPLARRVHGLDVSSP